MKNTLSKLIGVISLGLILTVEGLAFNGTLESFAGSYSMERSTDDGCPSKLTGLAQGSELTLKGESPSWTLHVSRMNQGPTFREKLDTITGRWTLYATETVVAYYPNRTEILVLEGPVKSKAQPLRRGTYHQLNRYRSGLEMTLGEFTTDSREFLELHVQRFCLYK